MKIYVIVPINYEYDDNYYNEEGLEEPIAAFTDRAKAALRLYDLNQEKLAGKGRHMSESYETPITSFYKMVELEADESEIVGANGQKAGKP